MDYDKIILDLLNRMCTLEEKVNMLMENKSVKVSTNDVKDYIKSLKEQAICRGEAFIVLVSNDIHNALKLKSRMPIVCNAMTQSMSEKDEIVHQTASGYSSTLTIKYYL